MASDDNSKLVVEDDSGIDEEFFDLDKFSDEELEANQEPLDPAHPDDREEVFDIQDFTCATAWERLISSISKSLKMWGLNDGIEDVEDKWLAQMEDVKIGRRQRVLGRVLRTQISEPPYNLTLEYHYITHRSAQRRRKENPLIKHYCRSMCELVSRERDHTASAPSLSQWYGLTRYLILTTPDNKPLDHETCSFLLSSMNLAVSQVGCTLAYFIPQDASKNLYQGSLQCNQFRVNFRSREQREKPVLCGHLSGLLEVFNRSLAQYANQQGPAMGRTEKAKISATFTYVRPCGIPKADWAAILVQTEGPACTWGPVTCPLASLHLHTTWPFFQDGKYHENAIYTTFDPEKAPKWVIQAEWVDFSETDRDTLPKYKTPLARSVFNLLDLGLNADPMHQWDYHIPMNFSTDYTSDDEILSFPGEAKGESIEAEVRNLFLHVPDKILIDKEPPICTPKTAPHGTLLSRFVIEILDLYRINMHRVGVAWREFIMQVGKHWHQNKLLPYITGEPDLRCCLLHQKLQLLNECICRKNKQEEEWVDNIDEDLNDSKTPQGVEKPLDGFFLVNNGDTPINIPLTLEQPMYTADTLQERFAALQDLGSSMEATKKRAELQNAQLISDIAGFKAANPEGTLEDFIRWYSPNDWISPDKSETVKGKSRVGELSVRMKAPDNIWQSLWQKTESCPASRQEPLFDFMTEGEKVLKWLETRTPMETLIQLSQVAVGASISILGHTVGCESNVDPLLQNVDSLSRAARLTWRWDDQNDMHFFDLNGAMHWCRELGKTEIACARTAALLHFFHDQATSRIVEFLIRPPNSVQIVTERERKRVLELCSSEDGFPQPQVKQFSLTKSHPRPHLGNRHVPNRLYAYVGPEKFCLATAFGMSYD